LALKEIKLAPFLSRSCQKWGHFCTNAPCGAEPLSKEPAAAPGREISFLYFPRRIFVPRGSSWRIVDMHGRQLGRIGSSNSEWTAPQHIANMPLFLVPCGDTKGKIVRLMMDR
jgi:hypothetical protein